jgi:queuine tRNA-ribosyltransferase
LNVNEILGLRMLSVHNSHLFLRVMTEARSHLQAGTFSEFRREFVAQYQPTRRVLAARQAHQEKAALKVDGAGAKPVSDTSAQ